MQQCVCFGSLLDNTDQPLKRGILIPATGIFGMYSLALGGSVVSPDEKDSFKLYMYIHSHTGPYQNI